MAEEARHHHYIPQAYLRGFAQKKSERQWYTQVTDLKELRTYTANVRNVCGERDFMRIEIDGHAPDAIEKEMAKFESKSIEAIRRVASTGIFEGEDANWTLNLMALLAVRSPEMRENHRDFQEQVAKRLMDVTLASKDRWESQTSRMKADGVIVNDVSYEEMKEFHKKGKYKVNVAREFQIDSEFKMMGTVLTALSKRLWNLYISDGSKGEFLTTNRPVTLTYIDPEKVPAIYRHSPGFGVANTEVFFPLTRHALLIGRFDRGGQTLTASESLIAAVNTHMMSHCHGKAFSRELEFLYLNPQNLTIYRDGKLLERAKASRDQSSKVN